MTTNEKEPSFKFGLGDKVNIWPSVSECGMVVARAQYINAEAQYLVHYLRGGCAAEAWWRESVLRRH